MNLITGIQAQAKQIFNLTLANGSTVTINLLYRPQQLGWFFDIAWGDSFLLNGQRIANHPNILRQFRHKIPFGLAILSQGNVEPTALTDLSDGSTALFLLDSTDVETVEATVFAA